jgi:translation initiation factor 3 subunit G
MSTPARRWGDDLDDSDDEEPDTLLATGGSAKPGLGLVIPPTHKSRVDAKSGIQIVTSYRPNPSHPMKLLKTVSKVKITLERVREPVAVGERRKWTKFGQALKDDEENNKTTVQSKDDIVLEDPNADTDLQDEDPAQAIAGNLNAFWAKQQRRQLERKFDVGGDDDPAAAAAAGGLAAGWTQVGVGGAAAAGGGAAAGGKYVPPSARAGALATRMGGAAAFIPERRTDDLNTIRVTNLSENTTEADLQDLFQRFGRISRVYLAKDKETMQSRGFAFVSFVNKDDAAKAMDELQGFGYDHLILKLEWARPNTPKDPASGGTEFRSGYGKALAQDTTSKVSYASNLTHNG